MASNDEEPDLPPGYYLPNDLPSFGERPTHASGADLTLYWPWVRPCWEPDDGQR